MNAIILAAALSILAVPGPLSAQVTTNSVKLKWSAPGDDSLSGRASSYDLRFSTAAITATNFASATRVVGTPTPGVSGTTDSITVTGLAPGTQYWFAIKTADEVPNWSAVSNTLGPISTMPPPDMTPPARILNLRLGWYDLRGRRIAEPRATGLYFAVDSLGERRLVLITPQGSFPGDTRA